MAELEFAGMKFKGGKIIMIITALSTLAGGLWGGFEVYKDYMNMREKIESYHAPDLSGIERQRAVLKQDMTNLREIEKVIKESANDSREYTRDIKNDLKEEIHHMSTQLDSIEKRGKEAFRLVRDSIEVNDTKVREMITVNSERFDTRREQLRTDMDNLEQRMKTTMKELEKGIKDKIQKALENPLANMRK